MSSRSKNNQVKLSERYYVDYMGASQFETGSMGRSIRAMNGNAEIGEFVIDGIKVYACWNKDHYNAAGVQEVLTGLYNGLFWVQERIDFTARHYQQQKALEKNRTALRKEYPTNAWFDIEGGLFWTWEKINIKDIPLNIVKSVAWMDMTPEQQREAANPGRIHPTLGGKFGALRDQLKSHD
jgi:hypothetical protein